MKLNKALTIILILVGLLIASLAAGAGQPGVVSAAPPGDECDDDDGPGGDDDEECYTVDIDPADFVAVVDNPYFPLTPGTKTIFEGEVHDGLERTEVEVLADTKVIMGVTTTIVRDTVYLNDELIEDTFDWYAQDNEGNVWYFGEDTKEYEGGVVVSTFGSWEAGVDGALPGIIMWGDPAAHIGEIYRQEYYPGVAEDMAEVLSLSESVTVPYGSFDDVLQTEESTPLEHRVREHKFYAQGIGLIMTVDLRGGDTAVLVEVTAP
ncbi:MAG: hypothetical protein L0332_31870 [Chloroflexi bacterium]|nr:hypothetical protein [Chloroflexota bacterium]MCI0645434.1 hypothetical protein [Chloroflexota bacterium]MCI0731300.1 hypothetical protein [Chloroflexota bacterium]